MELWYKLFLLEEDYDELEMAYCMVCLLPKRPVYHGRFSMDDFGKSEFLANFRFAKKKKRKKKKERKKKKINNTFYFQFNKNKKNKTFNKIYRIRA